MRSILSLFLVAGVAFVQDKPAQDKPKQSPQANEAEELFKQIEQKHLKAKSLKYKVNIKIEERGGFQEMESEGIIQEGNKLKITLEAGTGGKVNPVRILCDGKQKHIDSGQGKVRVTDAPEDLAEGLRYTLVRGGAALAMELVQSLIHDKSLKDKTAVEDLKLGKDEKVGERNCKVLTYTLVMTGPWGRPAARLWVDAETHAFVKRELKFDQGGLLVETYSSWKLDEEVKDMELDPSAFQGKPASYWITQLDQKDAKVRAEAVRALSAIGPAGAPGLVKAFKDGDRQIQVLAFQSLRRLGPTVGKQAIPAFLEAVKDSSNVERRQWAAMLLVGMGPEADKAVTDTVVPMLIELLDAVKAREQGSFQAWSVSVIESIGPRARAAVPALLELLHEKDEMLRQSTARALALIGSDGGGIPALIAVTKDLNHVGRLQAVRALGETAVESKEAVLALVEALKDQDPQFREEGRMALRLLGPKAKAAIPALLEALKDETRPDGQDSAFTLGCVAGAEDLPALLAALKGPDARVRGGVADALGTMTRRSERGVTVPEAPGETALAREQRALKAAVSPLVQALKDSEVMVRENAAWALGMIGPEAREAVPALIEALKDRSERSRRARNGSVRGNATEALGRIEPGAAAATAVPTLLGVISGKEADSTAHRSFAFQAIGSILAAQFGKDGTLVSQPALDQAAAAAVPALIKIIKKKGAEPFDVEMAMGALAAIGPRARAAVPVIKGLIQDKNFTLPSDRSSLVHVLWSISGQDKAAAVEIRKLTNDPEECIRRAAIQLLELESVQRLENGEK